MELFQQALGVTLAIYEAIRLRFPLSGTSVGFNSQDIARTTGAKLAVVNDGSPGIEIPARKI